MSSLQEQSSTICRLASDIMSNTTFKKVVRENNCDFFYNKVRRYQEFDRHIKASTISDFIKLVYTNLTSSYRTEYVYKNIITDYLVSKPEFIKDAIVILNEFKIAKSIADLVFINGSNRVYEIKTELDSPERLRSQLADYKKMFSEVYIVTHWTLEDKYLKNIENDDCGLIILNSELKLNTVKDASKQSEFLDSETMLKCLRKQELINVVTSITGDIPELPNTQLFKYCLNVTDTFQVEEVQIRILSEIKKRRLKELALLNNVKTLKQLRHICLCLDFSAKEYDILHNFLILPLIN